jgi:ABC-type uncharacterized transport system substrate-binding protein
MLKLIKKNLFYTKSFTIFSIIVILLISNRFASAHPHIFIIQRFEAFFDDQGFSGIKVSWNFDEMFSNMIAEDYDKNRNGSLEKEEVELIKKEAFSYISQYNYFIFIKIDNKPFEIKYIKDFSASLEKGKISYEFFVPCHVNAIEGFKNIIISGYDPTYYSAIFFAENSPVTLKNSEQFEIKTSIKKDDSTRIYYDTVNPWALFLDFKLKK